MDKYSLHEVSLSCAEAVLKAALFITPDQDKQKALPTAHEMKEMYVAAYLYAAKTISAEFPVDEQPAPSAS